MDRGDCRTSGDGRAGGGGGDGCDNYLISITYRMSFGGISTRTVEPGARNVDN